MTVRLSTTIRNAGEVVSNQENVKIILIQEEYDNLRTAFCKGKGWSLDYPHTVNVDSITLKGNYKWKAASDVEFSIEIG